MRIRPKTNGEVVEIELVQEWSDDKVEVKSDDWYLVTFVVCDDGKIRLLRPYCIDHSAFAVDEQGRIELVDE